MSKTRTASISILSRELTFISKNLVQTYYTLTDNHLEMGDSEFPKRDICKMHLTLGM